MKAIQKFLGVSALAGLAMSFQAQSASAFQINGSVVVNPNVVEATFCNYSWEVAVNCRVQAVGYTNTGYPIYAWANMTLYPGQCEYAYVYANYPFYFMNGSGVGQCSFAY